jgi:GNAT superfamily N-acetyltransferase
MNYRLRKATFDDQVVLRDLIARSARELSTVDYKAEQVEGALRGAFGVDTQLIADGTYFVVEAVNDAAGGDGRLGTTAAESAGSLDASAIEALGSLGASAAEIVGCGGWSYRRTLFGSDSGPRRDASELNPAVDAAKIRAFFIDPAHARRGLGTLLLNRCESEAAARGFSRIEMMATLPGQKLYAARGYAPAGHVIHELAPGLTIDFVPMRKDITPLRA